MITVLVHEIFLRHRRMTAFALQEPQIHFPLISALNRFVIRYRLRQHSVNNNHTKRKPKATATPVHRVGIVVFLPRCPIPALRETHTQVLRCFRRCRITETE